MDQKTDLIIKGLRQRLVEVVARYEEELIRFRVDATIENERMKSEAKQLQDQIDSLESELQLFRNAEMEVDNEKC